MTIKDDFLSMTMEEKIQLQLERLQSTLNRAYRNVPFHKKRFKDMGIDISEVNRLTDLARLPFMERHHISDNYPYDLFAVPLRDIVRIHTAPGTTQKPTVSGYTPQDLSIWQTILTRALLASNITPHDILQITLNPGLANWGRDYKSGAEAIEASVIPHTPMSVEKKVMVLMDYRTSVLITTPASARQLADYVKKEDINTTAMGLKTLILVGEAVNPETRNLLEAELGVTVWTHYGLSEVPGPAIAFECETHEGLHVNEDHFLPEIVDPVSGDVLPDDRFGELVLTTLTTRAFPLIRFKTGDRARIIRETCSCGRQLRRIEWTGERVDDLLNIDGVKVHTRQMQVAIESLLGFSSNASTF
ncbi:MAG: phenylacetate--CoA ligase family protein, partial [Desulfosalsimonadaceae bacterium]|nr:phenylacetate--CoA ligase family protein [Desulfosalsimonadaceae bacterium]